MSDGASGLQHAVDVVEGEVRSVAMKSQGVVRRHPLTSVGVAVGAGVATGLALGVVAERMLASRRTPPSVLERLGAVALFTSAARGLGLLVKRIAS